VPAAETQPAQATTSTTGDAGISEPVTKSLPNDVGGTETDRGVTPGPARGGRQLGQTGDGTRRLILLGGVALLLGAVVVAFTGRDRPDLGAIPPAGPPGRRPRPRRELDGWEDGIPMAPAKRELTRHLLGISAEPLDDEPGA
jgi:hypothetical protein